MPEIFDSASTHTKPKTSPAAKRRQMADATETHPTDETLEKEVVRMTTEKRRTRHVDEYSDIMRHESPSHNPFAAFAAKPFGTTFESQHAEEQVLLLLRQSLITQIHHLFIAIGLALVPLLFNYVGLLNFLPERFQFVATIGWYLIVVGYVLEVFLNWFYNVYIITDERIIDVDFDGLLFKNVSYAKLDNIEDITAKTAGALGSIFDFGDVRIQTAGAEAQFEFANVPHPSKVVAFLNELLIEEEHEFLERRTH
jgi:hypothetical protein